MLRLAVKSALKSHAVPRANIGLVLMSDEQMSYLHQRHLGLDGPTDVLTFDLREYEGPEVEGEIALGLGVARREGLRRGHGTETELALYAIHGVLHLLNYSDEDKDSAAVMHAMEDRILESMGLGAVFDSNRAACTCDQQTGRARSKSPARTN